MQLGADGVNRASINTGAAVDAGVSVDNPLGTLLADGVDRAGIFASGTVGAVVGNLVSQVVHLLYCNFDCKLDRIVYFWIHSIRDR